MSQNQSSCQWKLGIVSTLVIARVLTFAESFALAQIQTDATLGSESSIITPKLIDGQLIDQIDGGAIRGTNLFHSFQQFSVSAGTTDLFKLLVFTTRPELRTVQLALAGFQEQFTNNWPLMMAAVTIATLPVMVLFIIGQRQFLQGIVATGIKN